MQVNIKKCTPHNKYVNVQSKNLLLNCNKNALLWGRGCIVQVLIELIYTITLKGRMEDGLWGEGYYERNCLYLS